MDLKDFIKETISALVNASQELQHEFEGVGVIINPPVSASLPDLYIHGDPSHQHRRVETVEFDVAVTAASETSVEAKAALKVLSFGAEAESEHSRQQEKISRVRFSMPLVLSPAAIETENKTKADLLLKEREAKGGNLNPRKGIA
jgi:hypothetical protein